MITITEIIKAFLSDHYADQLDTDNPIINHYDTNGNSRKLIYDFVINEFGSKLILDILVERYKKMEADKCRQSKQYFSKKEKYNTEFAETLTSIYYSKNEEHA